MAVVGRHSQGFEENVGYGEKSPKGKSTPGTPVRSASVGNGHPRKTYQRTPTTPSSLLAANAARQDGRQDEEGRVGQALPADAAASTAARSAGGGYDNYGSVSSPSRHSDHELKGPRM